MSPEPKLVPFRTVKLGERRSQIFLREGLLDEIHRVLAALPIQAERIALVTDSNVDRLYAERALRSLTRYGQEIAKIEVEPGESSKSLTGVADLYEAFVEAGLDRESLVISFGGGVLGDLAGFAAATYLRGVPFFQIPTTLLAQLDASVGGKTGINLPWGKNLAGAFHQPVGVLIDPELLATLPIEELRSGLAEAIKVAAVLDAQLFDFLERNREAALTADPKAMLRVLSRAIELKCEIVERDEKDTGPRMLLNFGHTVGHAIEAAMNQQGIAHGEAVAIGMTAAAILSVELGICKPQERDRLLRLLRNYGEPTRLPDGVGLDALFEAMGRDKKRQGDALRFALLEGIGKGKIVGNVDPAAVRKTLAVLL